MQQYRPSPETAQNTVPERSELPHVGLLLQCITKNLHTEENTAADPKYINWSISISDINSRED